MPFIFNIKLIFGYLSAELKLIINPQATNDRPTDIPSTHNVKDKKFYGLLFKLFRQLNEFRTIRFPF